MPDRESSPAFQALGRSAKKVLSVIETEIAGSGGDSAQISHLPLWRTITKFAAVALSGPDRKGRDVQAQRALASDRPGSSREIDGGSA